MTRARAADHQRQVWTERADHWDEAPPPGLEKMVAAVLAEAERLGAPTDGQQQVVVDLGTGTGQVALPLAAAGGRRVVAVDVSPRMIELLEHNARERNLQVEGVVSPMETFDLPAGSVDLVVTNYALHHLRDRDKALVARRIAGWLRPGGTLVIGDMMFGRGGEARDWVVAAGKMKALIRRGPAGVWRIAKNVFRFLARHDERPVSITRWVTMLEEAGFEDVTGKPVIAEGAVVCARRPAKAGTAEPAPQRRPA